MAFTTDDVITAAKARLGLGDSTAHDTSFLQWMEDCQAELDSELSIVKMGWKETYVDLNVVANTAEYSIVNSLGATISPFHISNVFFKDASGDKFYGLSFNQRILDENFNPVSPETSYVNEWALRGSKIVLRGIPDAAITSGLRVYYLPDTTALTSGDSVEAIKLVKLLMVLYICRTYVDTLNATSGENIYTKRYMTNLERFLYISKKRYSGGETVQDEMDW